MVDFTTVCGVDSKHFQQLCWTWPTWKKWKPNILEMPMLIFRESSVPESQIRANIDHPELMVVEWPPESATYSGDTDSKWYHPQRYKMLSGFVHVPALYVETPYWLKLDTDVVANHTPDWIDEDWFRDDPAIIAHRWGYTKPPNQMELLDNWVRENQDQMPWLSLKEPLHLYPEPNATRVSHARIISFCGFFQTKFSQHCSTIAERVCGIGQLPVPSQDGFHWYAAKRIGYKIIRTNMKSRGWQHWSTTDNILKAVE